VTKQRVFGKINVVMTKLLNGQEIADFIKARQLHQARGLIQHDKIQPKLAILTTSREGHENAPIETYMRMKQRYGADIQVEVEIFRVSQVEMKALIEKLNTDDSVQGIIIQLPVDDPSETDMLCDLVAPGKDVDGLGKGATLDPATPMAINWLLAGYNIELRGKNIVIVGDGKLVGRPLARMWRNSGYSVDLLGVAEYEDREKFHETMMNADVIVSATGVPNVIQSDSVKIGSVVVDAGTASEHGKIVGDVAIDVRERSDVTITPEKGGVGPLTIAALFDNVLRAARERL
jgi:methylenetetrahydrofolate dehydrogenase (NADP+)/methenyltetrahydrofolate cyclohydrolase